MTPSRITGWGHLLLTIGVIRILFEINDRMMQLHMLFHDGKRGRGFERFSTGVIQAPHGTRLEFLIRRFEPLIFYHGKLAGTEDVE